MAVVGGRTVGSRNFSTLGNGQEPIIAACRPDIEEIGATTGLYDFGKDLISIILTVAS